MPHRLSASIAAAGVLSATLAVALAAHTAIDLGNVAGLLGGDYGSHRHGTIFPLGLAGLTAGLSAAFFYIVHLAGAGLPSLPSLARRFLAHIGWRTVAIVALAASLVLVGMETAEQLVSGRFDGLLSAFGGSPAIGLGLILLLSCAATAGLRALCAWLAEAHARIVLAVACLLRCRDQSAPCARTGAKSVALGGSRYACDIPQALGDRGPPILAR
ncbi:MAG TPA: hypothetical protein VMU38_06825 [Candidatus Binatia bacterium]|nr:hypothetical protein [Candidatus Binatia bacterium]